MVFKLLRGLDDVQMSASCERSAFRRSPLRWELALTECLPGLVAALTQVSDGTVAF